jgi:hypothetical protein
VANEVTSVPAGKGRGLQLSEYIVSKTMLAA